LTRGRTLDIFEAKLHLHGYNRLSCSPSIPSVYLFVFLKYHREIRRCLLLSPWLAGSSYLFFLRPAIGVIIDSGGMGSMAKRIKKRRCAHCSVFFRPDPRNARHQKFCSKPECRKASKTVSQRRWRQKEENRHYFQSPDHVRRVQYWRKQHPGYGRWRMSSEDNALQDGLSEETVGIHLLTSLAP